VVPDHEEVIESIRKSEVWGRTNESPVECWPSEVELRAKSEEALQTLRLQKIEWLMDESREIASLRFTLSDG